MCAAALNSKSVGIVSTKSVQEQAYAQIDASENVCAYVISEFLEYGMF